MNTELEMLDTLLELRELYRTGELRDTDFDQGIQRIRSEVADFEREVNEHVYSQDV